MEKSKYNLMMENYPILFCQRNKSEMETCICWGIEADEGWYEPINDLCKSLELLNHIFRHYNIRIQADQVKSKYAELRFYYSIIMERNIFLRTMIFPFKSIINLIDKHVNFQYEKIIDKPEYIKESWNEISKDDYDNKVIFEWQQIGDNKSKFKEENGKYYRSSYMRYAETFHYELKNHFIFDRIKTILQNVKNKIERIPHSKKRIYYANSLDKIVDGLIGRTEQKCWNTCEWCGHYDVLGHDIFTKKGWLTRICRSCSEEYEDNQVKSFDLTQGREYSPRIVCFDSCYNFLNKFDNKTFRMNSITFDSIWSAYYYHLFKNSNIPSIQKLSDFFNYLGKANSEYYYYIGDKLAQLYQVSDDHELMTKVIENKYLNGYNQAEFIRTKGKALIYFNHNCDNYWGFCLCDKCKDKEHKNFLGKIVEKVRDNYIIEEKKVKDGNRI